MTPVIPAWQGATLKLLVTCWVSAEEDAPFVDLSGSTAIFLMKNCLNDPDDAAVITKTHLDGISYPDAANGKALVTIPGDELEVLDVNCKRNYYGQVSLRLSDTTIIMSPLFKICVYQGAIADTP